MVPGFGGFQRRADRLRSFPVSRLVRPGNAPCAKSARQFDELFGPDGIGRNFARSSRPIFEPPGRCIASASQIMVVNGSQHALDLSARVLLDPDSPVWIEEPGYEFLRHALTLSGCRLVPVPVDSEGLDVAAGVRLCRNARVAYVTPSHQYPLGATMSAARRLQLLEWAHSSSAWIVEDDYDSEYRYESMPVASMQGLDSGSRVIYIGTFSKTLFPALRLGYMVIPAALVGRFLAVRQANDLCPSHLYQAALADFISGGSFRAARPENQAVIRGAPQCAGASASERVRLRDGNPGRGSRHASGGHSSARVVRPEDFGTRRAGRSLAVASFRRLRRYGECPPRLHSRLWRHESG